MSEQKKARWWLSGGGPAGSIEKEVIVHDLKALAAKMRHGVHVNLVDVPASHDLESWTDDLDAIISRLAGNRVNN